MAEVKLMEATIVTLIIAAALFFAARTLSGPSGGCGCAGGGGKGSCRKEGKHEH